MYSKQSKFNLPYISNKITPIDSISLKSKQQSLSLQLATLNKILSTQGLHILHNLIFTSQVKNRLAGDIMECLRKEHRLVAYGFQVKKMGMGEVVRKELVGRRETFKERLHEESVRSVEKYEREKHRQLAQIDESRYRINSTINSKFTNNPNPFTNNANDSPHKNHRNFNKLQGIYNYNTSKKIATEVPQDLQSPLTLSDIQNMLKHLKNPITIYLPPKSYPQFYGILLPSLSSSSKSPIRCRIQKYIFFKQSLNQKLFLAILEYLQIYFKTNINYLEMMMSKKEYNDYFKQCGWRMKSWEGVEKIYAVFQGKLA